MQEQPSFEGGTDNTSTKLDIETTNMLQMELIDLSGQDPEVWISEYSAAFRDVIDEDETYYARLCHVDHEKCIRVLKEKLDARILH